MVRGERCSHWDRNANPFEEKGEGLRDYNPQYAYFMNLNNRLYEFQITKLIVLKFSAAHGAFFFYCIFDVWKLICAVEAEVNLAFQTAMRSAADGFAAGITWSR